MKALLKLSTLFLWDLGHKAVVIFLLLEERKITNQYHPGLMLFVCLITVLCFCYNKEFIGLLDFKLYLSETKACACK